MEETTDSIRALASSWSLSQDEMLLNVLQTSHQRIVSKCREVNTKLDEMESALGETSIYLQNVNNKFMALSNSQFIESRVYDDDADITAPTNKTEELSKPDASHTRGLLKHSLTILDNAHEAAKIYDDSDSGSDVDISEYSSEVLKPRNVFCQRPLPHVIGSPAWNNKWHSGLLLEDSDSDICKQDVTSVEQFSESEDDVRTDKLAPDATISESGSSFQSERDKEPAPDCEQAAALATRLRRAPAGVCGLEESEDTVPQPTPNTVYRPEKPIASRIFSDEPPPLAELYEQSSSESQEDIFAEINKIQPNNNSNAAQDSSHDLFGRKVDALAHFQNKQVEPNPAKQKLFKDKSEAELFVEKPKASANIKNEHDSTKKPIGGISLFGTNKGTESIGAAILKRNRQKSSASDSESDETNKNAIIFDSSSECEEENSNVNDIFDNLFAKAKQAEQISTKPVIKDKTVKSKEVKDLFSDNIFDDIDDIFSSNIKIPTKESNKNSKSIFDDDDDMFSDIAKLKDTKSSTKPTTSKSVFDSDDELFSDVKVSTEIPKNKDFTHKKTSENIYEINHKETEKVAETESQVTKPKQTINNITKLDIVKDSSISVDTKNASKESKVPKVKKSIFDSDSDEGIFSEKIKTKTPIKILEFSSNKNEIVTDLFKKKKEIQGTNELKSEPVKVIQRPSLFEEAEIDDLFINANKAKESKMASVNTIIDNVISKDTIGSANQPKIAESNLLLEENLIKDIKTEINKDISKIDHKNSVVVHEKPIFGEPEPKTDINLFTNIEDVYIPDSVTDDFIESSQEPINVQSKTIPSSSIGITVESNSQEPEEIETATTINTETEPPLLEQVAKTNIDVDIPIFDEVPVKEKQDIIPEQKSLIPLAFDDIFKEPPAFEKTKENKKTVNVNALFDDDSDDEALFFKKNDVVSDEKPEIFSPTANFGLFDDEPPAFVEFSSQVIDKFNDDDLFSSIPKHTKTLNVGYECDQSMTQERTTQKLTNEDNNLLTSTKNPKLDIPVKITKEISDLDAELFTNIPKALETNQKKTPVEDSTDQLDEAKPKDINIEADIKKVGKLNTNNLNINVQALIPGASPKKIPKEAIDNTNAKQETLKEYITSNEVDNSNAKSISFESKVESGVLDNNLSKQRARIQVKRRPSSRKARLEAVRKSVIDIDDDTDNSSSFDEPLPNITNQNIQSKDNKPNTDEVTKISIAEFISDESKEAIQETKTIQKDLGIKSKSTEKKNSDKVQVKKKEIGIHKDFNEIDKILKSNRSTINIYEELSKEINKNHDEIDSKEIKSKINEKNQTQERSLTKVVYILNDEDIFANTGNNEKKNELLQNAKEIDDGDLFKSRNTYKETNENIETTNTNANTQNSTNETNLKELSKSVRPKKQYMFDVSDEDDLFGKTKPKKVEVKSKLFESDSEDDLFDNQKKNKKREKEKPQEKIVKGSLFGEDEDDDLFGVKIKTTQTVKVPTSSKSKDAATTSDIAFHDPLSMLDDD